MIIWPIEVKLQVQAEDGIQLWKATFLSELFIAYLFGAVFFHLDNMYIVGKAVYKKNSD